MNAIGFQIIAVLVIIGIFLVSRKNNKTIVNISQSAKENIPVSVEVEYEDVIRLLFDNKDKEYQAFLKGNITKDQLKSINAFIVENEKRSFYKTERIFIMLDENIPDTNNIAQQLLDELINIYLQMYILSEFEGIYNNKIQEIYKRLEKVGKRPKVSYERLNRTTEYMMHRNQ